MAIKKPKPTSRSPRIHLVFSSHWDREWYLPFQKYRAKLVRALDVIVEELASGHLPFYQMDGQFIPIEDYLAIRPEKEAQVRELVGSGRLLTGPWYNLPDGFLVSGESLVRNFQMGIRRSRAIGAHSRAGWLCDIFGHNSQMPQILQQLGIDNVFLWRGAEIKLGRQFRWRGADGSEVFTQRFANMGYGDLAHEIRQAHKREKFPSIEEMVDVAVEYLKKESEANPSKALLFFDGGDHLEFEPRMIEFAAAFNKRIGEDRMVVSTLDRFIDDVRAENLRGLKLAKGELRAPGEMNDGAHLIPGVSSSRIPIKRSNHACETLLTLWLEPWCAVAASRYNFATPLQAIELAWEYLLKNHPHDSICGCSPDETHEDMPYRFQQTRKIAEVYLKEAHEAIAAAHFAGKLEEKAIALSLFTSAGGSEQPVPEVTLNLPQDWPQFSEFFGFESKPSFRLFDQEGQEVAYQLLEVQPHAVHWVVPRNKFPAAEARRGIRIAIDQTLTPFSHSHLVVKRTEGPVRLPAQNSIGVGRDTLRNEFLEAQVSRDGTIILRDLERKREFPGLLAMEDTADIGDGWFHGVALQDRAFLSTGGRAVFGLLENGPLLARMAIRVEWEVPEEFDFQHYRRSPKLKPLVVEHMLTLRKGSRTLEVETTVHNTVRDHRLRIFCPTGFSKLATYWSDTPYDAVERPVELRKDNHLLRELQIEMTPQQNWLAAAEGKAGLALLSPGQYESAVLDHPDHPLCVTLLRGFRRAVLTDGNDGGQILGDHTIRMGLHPFTPQGGGVPAADLHRRSQTLAAPAQSLYLDAQDLRNLQWKVVPVSAEAPPSITGNVVLTSARRNSTGEWLLRVYNPSDSGEKIRLLGSKSWFQTDLLEENREVVKGRTITIGPRKIVTLVAL